MTRLASSGSIKPHAVTRYAEDVVAGRIVAGPHVRNECRRHLRDLVEAPKRGWVFSPAVADRALRYFPTVLRLAGGDFEGKPFVLQPSQVFIIGSLFGWVGRDGYRRFQTGYIEEGKGNGKSPLAAGIGLYCTHADGEARAEVYAAATKRDQAMVLFRDAVAMVDQSPPLGRAMIKTGRLDKVWNLFHRKSQSFFRVIANDDGKSGPRPSCALLDEIHEHKTPDAVGMMRAGFKGRKQPLMVMITNSGTDRTSVCWEYHNYGVNVSKGTQVDDRFFSYICSLDKGEDPFESEKCWGKANPLLGTTIELDYLRQQVREARGMPSKESVVRRLNFCEWVESSNPLIDLATWDKCERAFTLEKFRGRDVYIGLDLSNTMDLTAAVIACRIGRRHYWIPFFWLPKKLVKEKTKKDMVPYDAWVRAKHILTTPGKAIDKDYVVAHLAAVVDRFDLNVIECAYDRWGIEVFKSACERQGVDFEMVPHAQGFAGMGPAISALETALARGKLAQNGNPCLRMCVANAVGLSDPAGNRKFNKAEATGRIDGIVAGAMAQYRAALDKDEDHGDDYLRKPVIGR